MRTVRKVREAGESFVPTFGIGLGERKGNIPSCQEG